MLKTNDRGQKCFILACLVSLMLVAGCATTTVERNPIVTGKIPRPDTIWVHDFAATPADMPGDSFLAGQNINTDAPQTDQQIAEGRKLGNQIATELVSKILDMGMVARHHKEGAMPRINDIILRGYLISYSEGSTAARVGIGFGAGKTDLKVAVEGFQVTPNGLRKLGEGTADAQGGKTPGLAMGGAMSLLTRSPVGIIVNAGMQAYQEGSGSARVEGRAGQLAQKIADGLQQRFEDQGWISPTVK